MVNHLGQQLGNYRLTRSLGRGGYAQVYLGEHIYLHTQAALKVQHIQLREDDAQRFLAEARILAGLEHPNIVPVLDFGVHEAIPYLVMQYAPHGSLRAVHPRGTRLSLASIASYLTPIAAAIEYAHERGITHRDIKPENILLGSHRLLLSDFGLAVMSSNSSLQSVQHIAGTATYMAPEQLRGYLCQASDQYALGIVVYEWLCGFPPFVGDHPAVAAQHVMTPPPSLCAAMPDLSPVIEQIVFRALAKDPHQRFSSVMAFANALQEAIGPLATASPASKRRLSSSSTGSSSSSNSSNSSSGNGHGGRVHRRSLIGREPELIALRQALLEAEQCLSLRSASPDTSPEMTPSWSDPTRSSCVLLRGEPGIGKTRLAEELAGESYVRGWTVLWSRAYNQERSVPYLFWTQILREALRQGMWDIRTNDRHPLCYQPLITLLPEISDLFSSEEAIMQDGTPEQEQWRLWEAVFMVLADICDQRPLLLVLDDLHCADNSTVELLGYLVRRLRHAPLLIVGTYRDIEIAATHPLALLLAHLQREHAVIELSLPALTADQIAELVADVPKPFIRQIQQQVAGNPFFAEELALTVQQQDSAEDHKFAMAGLPDTITAVLGQRISVLSARCQKFLSHAAILGNSFPFTALALMEQSGKTPFDEDGLFASIEEALQARIITEEEAGSAITYSFWHPLLQTHLYEMLSAARRALLHKQAATALQQLYMAHEGEGAASITYHLVRAGAASPLVTHFAQLAGERAYHLSSYAEAEHYFAIAYEHLDASSEHEVHRSTLLQYLGECTRVQGKNDDARHYYQQVLHHQAELASPQISQQAQLQAMIWYEIGLTWFETGANAKALNCYEQGERVLRQAMVAAGPAWARLHYEQSYVYWREGDYAEARRNAVIALRLFTETLEQQSSPREQLSPATRISRTLCGDPVDLGRTYQLLGLIANCVGLSREALTYYQLALTYFEPHDCLREIAIVYSNLGDLYLRRADFEAAHATLHRSLLLVERIGDVPFSSVVLNNLGILAARTGDLATAVAYNQRGIVLSEQGNDPVSMCWLLVSLATALQEQNNEVESKETLKRCLTVARTIRVIPCIGAALVAIGRLRLTQVAACQIAEEHSGEIIDGTRQSLVKARKSVVHALALDGIEAETRVEGQLLLAQAMMLQEQLDDAGSLVIHVMQEAQKYELMALIAYAQRMLGNILFKQQQYQQATEAFEHAIADFRNYGMRLECARTLQDYGVALLKSTDANINSASRARECLQEARELFMSCQTTPKPHVTEYGTSRDLMMLSSQNRL